MKRREFIQTTALAAAGTLALPAFSYREKRNIGLQLYTLRDVINKDVKGTLGKVAGFGYKEVETFGYKDGTLFGMKSKDFSDLVKSLGMKMPSGHYGTGQTNTAVKGTLVNDWERAVADAKEAGQEYMIIAYLQPAERQSKSMDDYKKVCDLINKGSEVCKKYNMRLGYHNHDFEFKAIDGILPYDVMLKELDPKLVCMEMDLYWIIFAGQDPLKYFASHPGRFEQWHIKDMDKSDRRKNANLGTGSIDFKPIFAKASQAGLKHFYIEHDTYPGSSMESVEADIKYLATIV